MMIVYMLPETLYLIVTLRIAIGGYGVSSILELMGNSGIAYRKKKWI